MHLAISCYWKKNFLFDALQESNKSTKQANSHG